MKHSIFTGAWLCVLLTLTVDGRAETPFLKSPWLIYDGTVSDMTVIWQMDSTHQCLLEWGTDSTYSMGSIQTAEYGTEHMHAYTIPGLSPSTKYFYQVSCSAVSYQGSFHAAPPATSTDVSFMVYGDTRTFFMVHDELSGVMVDMYTGEPRYQTLIISTGDNVEFGAAMLSWQNEFFNDAAENLRQRMLELPFTSCLGNHELYLDWYSGIDLDTPLFGQYFPYPYVNRRYWSFDYGPVHIVIVDQYPEEGYDPYGQGLLSAEEISWIQSDLATTTRPWKVVILHEPGWSAGSDIHPYNNDDVQTLLQPICEAHGVHLVFAAHNHYYARACRNGIHHVTTGGGSAPLYPPLPGFPNLIFTEKVHHFCLLDFDQEELILTAVSITGDTVDQFTIPRVDPTSHLLGFVTVNGGSGIVEDVLVSANGSSDNPDETGYYGMRLDPGMYDVTASLDGYESLLFENVEVVTGTETTLDVSMYPTSIGEGDIPCELRLYAPDPNPFSSSTSIAFILPESGPVSLRVFDLSGRLVETLVDGTLPTGEHSVDIDGTPLSAGIYIYRLETDGEVLTGRCVKLW